MSINYNQTKRIPLQRYWTTRYLLTILVGLIVIAIISAIWIRHTTIKNRVNMMEFMSEEMANRFTGTKGELDSDNRTILGDRGRFMDMESNPYIYIVSPDGKIISSNRPLSLFENQLSTSILDQGADVQKVRFGSKMGPFYIVKKPIQTNNLFFGWVVMIESQENLAKVKQEYRQLSILIFSIALLGWAAIYILSNRLSKPIKDVAMAAQQVRKGNYQIELPSHAKEEEVDELIQSFRGMSQQLQKLESLRTELLAGVTHELKTPVTSISGLLQAVNDGVVTGEEAKEFLAISLQETEKMKTMVEDLLAFNSFAANAVPVSMEDHSLPALVEEIVHQWKVGQGEEKLQLILSLPGDELVARVDPLRLKQVMTNLLNNAKHAMEQGGALHVTVGQKNELMIIDVADQGVGIPEEEHDLVFERFYRGEGKKFKVGGLGLGLPFSKMIAQAMGGDLNLLHSSPSGTTFRITLPFVASEVSVKGTSLK